MLCSKYRALLYRHRINATGIMLGFLLLLQEISTCRSQKQKPEIRAQAQGLRFIVSNGFLALLFASTICGQIFNTTVTENR